MKFTPNDITPEMIKAAEMIFAAKAFVETIKPVVIGYQEKILKKHKFRQAAEWSEYNDRIQLPDVITRVQDAFLMSDEDFKIYPAECNEERKKAGLKVEKEEHCPLCVAEHILSQAESHLIDLFTPLTGISDYKIWGDNRKKYLDLTLKLLAPFVGKSDAILAGLRGAA